MSQIQHPYTAFSKWLKKRYGCRVRKVPLSTPFGCPNRDGKLSKDGCIFCDENMAGCDPDLIDVEDIGRQLLTQIMIKEGRAKKPQKYMPYFQRGTNTYGKLEYLRKMYSQALVHDKVVTVSIGTRPDCIDEEILNLIGDVFAHKDVWIELGVQSVNESTLNKFERNHTLKDVKNAVKMIKNKGFFICAHLILGLVGEESEDMLSTIHEMNRLKIHGVKFHPLSITKGSKLERIHQKSKINILSEEEYIDLVIDLLRHLDKEIVIQRLVGGGRPEMHLEPKWSMRFNEVIQKIIRTMWDRNVQQGDLI